MSQQQDTDETGAANGALMPRFPPELLIKIVRATGDDTPTLTTLARLSRNTNELVLPVLYHTITLSNRNLISFFHLEHKQNSKCTDPYDCDRLGYMDPSAHPRFAFLRSKLEFKANEANRISQRQLDLLALVKRVIITERLDTSVCTMLKYVISDKRPFTEGLDVVVGPIASFEFGLFMLTAGSPHPSASFFGRYLRPKRVCVIDGMPCNSRYDALITPLAAENYQHCPYEDLCVLAACDSNFYLGSDEMFEEGFETWRMVKTVAVAVGLNQLCKTWSCKEITMHNATAHVPPLGEGASVKVIYAKESITCPGGQLCLLDQDEETDRIMRLAQLAAIYGAGPVSGSSVKFYGAHKVIDADWNGDKSPETAMRQALIKRDMVADLAKEASYKKKVKFFDGNGGTCGCCGERGAVPLERYMPSKVVDEY